MKLYNRTRISDDILSALLVKAGKSVGANTSGVVVKVNTGHHYVNGTAWQDDRVYVGSRWINTDRGHFRISLPMPDRIHDAIDRARDFLYVARHEWGHIRDYQAGGRRTMEFSHRSSGGRRPSHDSRPEEIRAENYIYDSDKRLPIGSFDDVVLDLAVALEAANQ